MLSSAIPYSLETEALRRIPANVFGVLMSMEPAVAALAGFVVLGQDLGRAGARGDRARRRRQCRRIDRHPTRGLERVHHQRPQRPDAAPDPAGPGARRGAAGPDERRRRAGGDRVRGRVADRRDRRLPRALAQRDHHVRQADGPGCRQAADHRGAVHARLARPGLGVGRDGHRRARVRGHGDAGWPWRRAAS